MIYVSDSWRVAPMTKRQLEDSLRKQTSNFIEDSVQAANERVTEESIEESIEKKRNELIKVGTSNGLHSKKAVEVSQQLDQLLNKYDRLLKEKITK
ncbi:aspartyl-phosphate phosphatase Spo0E family protein [Alkalihalophilus pseudofirmus]|uniref:aspartyl-phosphate phosphatase Spo0E family protein n=1 Tax=Alkalihalophilus pseudofirmus TaxID=79885 RepID=UPI00259B4864|nr:aspartyl-phosphate phosphatase Spo0E family protein [Alkalihalophilus pseudofirmus]WEG15517.1 aspartyl-phosphate phosphatase Spo0E family protein [Alkalihalophilus pseudofirmus]